ncbi:MAG: 50S ribosomal protein L29 [Planctomycetaceae bacterium]|jgi:large subunit ribosomal protein L29|nr:50S ribosomal protein L29 [Planctomycetaceae bacterium]
MKANELRQMSSDQLGELLKSTEENYFRLRMQSRMERLDVPSELKKNRRLIARILTEQRQRELTQSKY